MTVRRALDALYDAAGILAALFMVGTLAMVLLGIGSRLLSWFVPGTDAYAGYCMAAAGFLALAHTFRRGEHIRVTLILEHVGAKGATRTRTLVALGGIASRRSLCVLQCAARVRVVGFQRHLHRQRRDTAVDSTARDGVWQPRSRHCARRCARPRMAPRTHAMQCRTKRCTMNDHASGPVSLWTR